MFHDAMPIHGLISVRPYATNLDDKAKALIDKVKILGQSTQSTTSKHGQKKKKGFDHSGDLEKVKQPIKDEILFGYADLDVWENEPEELKKIFTLEYADGRQRLAHEIHKLEEQFSEVCGPFWTLEKIIAKDTVHVRHLIKHCEERPRDTKAKVILEEKIAKRRKRLKQLRKLDYERFMWLLRTLKIQYTTSPAYPKKISRAGRIKQASREEAFAYKQKKMQELEEKIKQEYDKFKVFKEKELEEINQIVQEYGLDMETILKDIQQNETAKEIKIKDLL